MADAKFTDIYLAGARFDNISHVDVEITHNRDVKGMRIAGISIAGISIEEQFEVYREQVAREKS